MNFLSYIYCLKEIKVSRIKCVSWYVWQIQIEQTTPFPVLLQAFSRFMKWAEAEPLNDGWATDIRGLANARQSFVVELPLSVIWSFNGAFTRNKEDSPHRDYAPGVFRGNKAEVRHQLLVLGVVETVKTSITTNKWMQLCGCE